METIIACTVVGVFIFASFLTGLHYGSKIKHNEPIQLKNPIKIIKNHIEDSKEKEKLNREIEINEVNLKNIDNYNGTEIGQVDIPR